MDQTASVFASRLLLPSGVSREPALAKSVGSIACDHARPPPVLVKVALFLTVRQISVADRLDDLRLNALLVVHRFILLLLLSSEHPGVRALFCAARNHRCNIMALASTDTATALVHRCRRLLCFAT